MPLIPSVFAEAYSRRGLARGITCEPSERTPGAKPTGDLGLPGSGRVTSSADCSEPPSNTSEALADGPIRRAAHR